MSGCAKNKNPSFLIHLTGTGCISDEREQTWEGKYNPHVWNDIDEINEIYDLPPSAQHHVIDQNMMDASNDKLKTAIICPPDIYGQNTGIGNRATFLVPEYVKVLLKRKEAFYLGAGENIRAVTHINDVVDLFMILIGEAMKGGGKAQWGREVCAWSILSWVSSNIHFQGVLLCRFGWCCLVCKMLSFPSFVFGSEEFEIPLGNHRLTSIPGRMPPKLLTSWALSKVGYRKIAKR